MKKNKNGFTMAEILIVLMIVGIIMALSIQSIRILTASYTSLAYFEFNTMKQIAGEMIAGKMAIPLKDDNNKEIKLSKLIETKNSNGTGRRLSTIITPEDSVFCKGMTLIMNTAGKKDCDALYTATDSSTIEPYINITTNSKPNFSTTNGRMYYVSKRITPPNGVSSTYGYRLVAVDLNGKSKPNTSVNSTRRPPDIITFLILDNGEIYPLGAAADNISFADGRVMQYLNSRVKGYYYNSYLVEKNEDTGKLTVKKSDEFREKGSIPEDCKINKVTGTDEKTGASIVENKQVCDYAVVYVPNINSQIKNKENKTGTFAIYSYREAFCTALGSEDASYKKYCKDDFKRNELCPPSSSSQKFDLCTVENVKPIFRYDL